MVALGILSPVLVDPQHRSRYVGGEPKSAPGFGDDDAIRRVMRFIPDLDRKVGSNVVDQFAERGDILRCLVADPGDAVVIDDDLLGGRSIVRLGKGSLDDAAVCNSTVDGEQIPPGTFDLFRRWARAAKEIPDKTPDGHRRSRCNGGIPRRAQGNQKGLWHICKHGSLRKA